MAYSHSDAGGFSSCNSSLDFIVYILYASNNLFHLPLAQMQTLMFVMLVFTGQINVYLVRERRHFWKSVPSRWMILGTVLEVIVVSILATQGFLMTAIPFNLVVLTLIVTLLYYMADILKVSFYMSYMD
jgi:H+-transporting ATPase